MLRALFAGILLAVATGCASMAPTLTDGERSGSRSIVILPIGLETTSGIKPEDMGNLTTVTLGRNPTGIRLNLKLPKVSTANPSEISSAESEGPDHQSETRQLDIAVAEAVAAASSVSANVGQRLPAEQSLRMTMIHEQIADSPNAVIVTLEVRASITSKLNQARIDVVQRAHRRCLPKAPSDCLNSSPERVFSFVSPVHTPEFSSARIKIRTDNEIGAELEELERKRRALVDTNASDERTKKRKQSFEIRRQRILASAYRTDRRILLSKTWTPDLLNHYVTMAIPQLVDMIMIDWRNPKPSAPWREDAKQFSWVDHQGRNERVFGRVLKTVGNQKLYELNTRQYASLPILNLNTE
ncbi:MAG: hypothetical protein AB8F65_08540 [Woeseiaceae bacterium]